MRKFSALLICLLMVCAAFIAPEDAIANTEPFVGEIKFFAGNSVPEGWVACKGQLLSISQYPGLFAVIGITYGGDGKNTFAMPDFREHIPARNREKLGSAAQGSKQIEDSDSSVKYRSPGGKPWVVRWCAKMRKKRGQKKSGIVEKDRRHPFAFLKANYVMAMQGK